MQVIQTNDETEVNSKNDKQNVENPNQHEKLSKKRCVNVNKNHELSKLPCSSAASDRIISSVMNSKFTVIYF